MEVLSAGNTLIGRRTSIRWIGIPPVVMRAFSTVVVANRLVGSANPVRQEDHVAISAPMCRKDVFSHLVFDAVWGSCERFFGQRPDVAWVGLVAMRIGTLLDRCR
jgi:hypothetical protein